MDQANLSASGEYLTDSDGLLQGLAAGEIGVWRWTVNTNRLDWSPNLEAVHGLPAGSFDGTLETFQKDVDPAQSEKVWAGIQHSLETGEPYRVTYRTARPVGDIPLWIEAKGRIIEVADGTRYLTGTCANVTDRVLARKELELRMRQQQAIAEFGVFAFGQKQLEPVMQRACEIAAQVLDVPLTKILRFAGSADHLLMAAGVGWAEGLVGTAEVPAGLDSQAGYTLTSREPVIVADLKSETRFSGPQLLHDYDVRSGMSVVIPGATSRPFGVFGIHSTKHRSFTEGDAGFLASLANIVANSARNAEAADQSLLLVREMAHRSGNMMQLVSTIASQTFSETEDRETALRAFNERLGSLARANYLVAKGGWTSTRFALLVADILNPFEGKLNLVGRDVLLPPELCFDLSLVIHELAANSARYGSLGADDRSKAQLSWEIERDDNELDYLTLVWTDAINREKMPQSPRQGFGSRLLEGLVVSKWNGELSIDRTKGYRFSARIPL